MIENIINDEFDKYIYNKEKKIYLIVCDNKEKEKLFNKFNKLIKKEKKETTI
jgi:hypothetical protein